MSTQQLGAVKVETGHPWTTFVNEAYKEEAMDNQFHVLRDIPLKSTVDLLDHLLGYRLNPFIVDSFPSRRETDWGIDIHGFIGDFALPKTKTDDLTSICSFLLGKSVGPELRLLAYATIGTKASLAALRRGIVELLCEPSDSSPFQVWRKYSQDQTPKSPECKQDIKAFKKMVFDLLQLIERPVRTEDSSFVILDKWRSLSEKSGSADEVFRLEAELFIEIKNQVSWAQRRARLTEILKATCSPALLAGYSEALTTCGSYSEFGQTKEAILAAAKLFNLSTQRATTVPNLVKTTTCFRCGKLGHMRDQCRSGEAQNRWTSWTKQAPKKEEQSKPEATTPRPMKQNSSEPFPPPAFATPLTTSPKAGRPMRAARPTTFNNHLSHPNDFSAPMVRCDMRDLQGDRQSTSILALVDSGAQCNVITLTALNKCSTTHLVREATTSLMTLAGEAESLGTVEALIRVNDDVGGTSEFQMIKLVVYDLETLPGGMDALLGCESIAKFGIRLEASGDHISATIVARKARGVTQSTQTGHANHPEGKRMKNQAIALSSVAVDPVEDLDPKPSDNDIVEIMANLRTTSASAGPVAQEHLTWIEERVNDPHVTLDVTCLHPPIRQMAFRTSQANHDAALSLLSSFEKLGFIKKVTEKTIGPSWCSRAFLIKKASNKFRLVVDLQAVNDRIKIPAGSRVHNIEDWKHSIPSHAKFYGVLDVKDAYYRKTIRKEDRQLLRMSIAGSIYEWIRMPQGLNIAPFYWANFIDEIREAIESARSSHCNTTQWARETQDVAIRIYADDILVCGPTASGVNSMMNVITQVCGFLEVYIPVEKRQGASHSVTALGLELKDGKFGPTDKSVAKIRGLKRPRTREELRTIIGMLQYVSFSLRPPHGLAPLQSLLSEKVKFCWGDAQEKCWQETVTSFAAFPLAHFDLATEFDRTRTLILQTDASDLGIGACLWVTSAAIAPSTKTIDCKSLAEAGQATLISVCSHRFTPTESRYSAFDRESFAIYFGLNKWRKFLFCFAQVVFIQCDNMASMYRFKGLQNDLIGDCGALGTRARRWHRWLSDISDIFTLDIRFAHVAGVENSVADYFSRHLQRDEGLAEKYVLTDISIPPSQPSISFVHALSWDTGVEWPPVKNTLLDCWKDDTTTKYGDILFRDIFNVLQGQECKNPRVRKLIKRGRFKIYDGLMAFVNGRRSAWCVPNLPYGTTRLRGYLIWFYHEGHQLANHRGITRLMTTIRSRFFWPRMDTDIAHYVETCVPCTMARLSQHRSADTFRPRTIDRVNQIVLVDFAGPIHEDGETFYILIFVDGFSSFCMAHVYGDKSADGVVDMLLEWCSLFGSFETWASDNDTAFKASVVRAMRQMCGMSEEYAATYCPISSGQVERMVGEIKQGLRALNATASHILPLALRVKACVWGHNSTRRYFGMTPFEVMLGREPQDTIDLHLTTEFAPEQSRSEYVEALKEHLKDVREYWGSRVSEARWAASDEAFMRSIEYKLEPGTQVAKRVNGQFLGTYTVIGPDEKHGLYHIEDAKGISLCPPHALVPIIVDEALREGLPKATIKTKPKPKDTTPWKRSLQAGDDFCSVWTNGDVYIGRVLQNQEHRGTVLAVYYKLDRCGQYVLPRDMHTDEVQYSEIISTATLSGGKLTPDSLELLRTAGVNC